MSAYLVSQGDFTVICRVYSRAHRTEVQRSEGRRLHVMSGESVWYRINDRCTTSPRRCTRSRAMFALECLPPGDWVGGDGSESFRVVECVSGECFDHYVRIGDQWWKTTRPRTAHADLIDLVAKTSRRSDLPK